MAHDDGNLAGSEGNPLILVDNGCGFGGRLHRLLDNPPRLVLCEELQLYNNSTETKDSLMNKLSQAVLQALLFGSGSGEELSTALNVGGQTPQNSFAAFQQFLRSRSFSRKQPKPYKRKVPRTQHDYFMLLRAERKRTRKAAKLSAQGFGTLKFPVVVDGRTVIAGVRFGGRHV